MTVLQSIISMMPKAAGAGIPSGLAKWFKFENDLTDAAGGSDLDQASSVSYGAGRIGSWAVETAPTTKYYLVPSASYGTTWAVEVWIKPTAGSSREALFGNSYNDPNTVGTVDLVGVPASDPEAYGYLRYLYNSTFIIDGSSSGCIKKDGWYKVSLLHSPGTTSMYVNNLFLGSGTDTGSWTNIGLGIGQFNQGGLSVFTGFFDDLKIWSAVPEMALNGGLVASFLCDTPNDSEWSWDTYSASPSYGTGRDGSTNGSWNFDGSTAGQIRQLHRLGIGSNWTISMDIFPDSSLSGNAGILYNYYNAGDSCPSLIYDASAQQVVVWHGGSNRLSSGNGTLPKGQWSTVKWTYDNSKIRMYVDGSLVATESGTHSSLWKWNGAETYFGQQHAFYPLSLFKGRMDNVKIYNAAV